MTKYEYSEPQTEVVRFYTNDVLLASSEPDPDTQDSAEWEVSVGL